MSKTITTVPTNQDRPFKIVKKDKMESFMLKHQESASLWNLVITKIFSWNYKNVYACAFSHIASLYNKNNEIILKALIPNKCSQGNFLGGWTFMNSFDL